MKLLDNLHRGQVYGRRVRTLSEQLAPLVPERAAVIDVGCGDGRISSLIQQRRPDISVEGIDVLIRPQTFIPVKPFDGERLPYPDKSADAVLFVDVLHHTADPSALLLEAARVAKRCVLLKDHTLTGPLAGPTLRFMDWVGNARHGVALPYNYWPEPRWREAFTAAGLSPSVWQPKLGLYPWWAGWWFERSLHFIARLDINPGAGSKP